jgi:signal peptidase II
MTREENNTSPSSHKTLANRLLSVLPDLRAHLIFWPLAVLGTVLDLWSKSAVFDRLQHQGSISIIDSFLRFVMASNSGAAFGMFSGHSSGLIVISGLALAVILAVFLFGGAKQRLIHVALGLFAAGVCGNLYDRIFNNGQVRDFIDVYYRQQHWPAFNVADSLLCIAVGLGIISCFWVPKRRS